MSRKSTFPLDAMSYLNSSFLLFVVCVFLLLLTACDSSTGIIESESDPSAGIDSPSLGNAIGSERDNEFSFSIDFHGDGLRLYQEGHESFFETSAEDPDDLRRPDSEVDFTGSVNDDGLGSFSVSNGSTQMLNGSAYEIYESDFSYSFSNIYRNLRGNISSWNLDQDVHPYLGDNAPLRYEAARQDLADAISLDDGDDGGGGGGGGGGCTTCILSEQSDSEVQRHFESQGYTVETLNTQDVKVSRSVGPRSANIEVVTTIDRQTGDVKGSVLKRNGNTESHFSVGTDAQGYPTLQSEMMTLRPGQSASDQW